MRKHLQTVAGKLCYERNLLVAMDGNLSAMLPSGDILCTKAGCHKGFLTDDDLTDLEESIVALGWIKVNLLPPPTARKAVLVGLYLMWLAMGVQICRMLTSLYFQ